MESHDLNTDEGLEALLKGARPAPLSDEAFTARVVAQLPAPAARPQPAWTAWIAAASVVVGLLAVLLSPGAVPSLREIARHAASASAWNTLGLAFAVLVGVWALFDGLGSEESSD